MQYQAMSTAELATRAQELDKQLAAIRGKKLALDLTRGKPSSAQLDLAAELDGILGGFYLLQDGTDVRNYGGIEGIPEARQLGADMLEVAADEIIVGGNSSLTLMYNSIALMIDRWRADQGDVKFICPVPGYDRHFAICEHFGIKMLTVAMTSTGPDMDAVERMVSEDPTIKGIWCVPKYSNPSGITYNDATVDRMAALGGKAGKDFRVFWDNAYAVHHLSDSPDPLKALLPAARKAGFADSVLLFASTSKITFAGAGIAFAAMSKTNLSEFVTFLASQTIGADKVNQLRHVRFLKDMSGLTAHMDKHKALLAPRFELVERKLAPLGELGVATWTRPNGGYFVSLDTLPGLADKVVAMAAELGVKLTPAGATYPYGNDPENRNIRIAPTYPALDELGLALDVLVASIESVTNTHLQDATA